MFSYFGYLIHGKVRRRYRLWGLYFSRLHSGQCVVCGEHKNSYSRFCDKHYDDQAMNWIRYDQRHKEQVLRKARRIRNYRRANKLCIQCGAPLHPEWDKDHVNCMNCREHLSYTY